MRSPRGPEWLLPAVLLTATGAVYWQVLDAGFVFDDESYILKNPHLQGGLGWATVRWALTSTYVVNWHPLTWISHLADVSLFGLRPCGHHAVNLLLHLCNTLILWFVVRGMTGAPSRAAIVAGLFALHPCHVESVAWVAERKDVLCALFFLLGLAAYRRHAASQTTGHLRSVFLLLALALAAKPMAVSFPFVLLLLDWWPLGRLQPLSRGRLLSLVREKIPLFVCSAAGCAATLYAQGTGGTITDLQHYSVGARLSSAVVAYLRYLGNTLWPARLSVFYPHPGSYPGWLVVAALLVVSGVTVAVIRAARVWPWATTGWLWYLGTLVPVIGLVQVGSQSMADRYTYLTQIGLFLAAVWGSARVVPARPWRVPALASLSAATLAVLAALSRSQAAHWSNQRALFEHALAVTDGNSLAHHNLGVLDEAEGRLDEAIAHYREAVRLAPAYYQSPTGLRPREPRVRINIGVALAQAGRYQEAIEEYVRALHIDPTLLEGHMNLGNALSDMGRDAEALPHYQEALRLNPRHPDAHYNYGMTLEKLGRREEAAAQYRETLRLQPDHVPAGVAYERQRLSAGAAR